MLVNFNHVFRVSKYFTFKKNPIAKFSILSQRSTLSLFLSVFQPGLLGLSG